MPEQALARIETNQRILTWVTIAAVVFVMATGLTMMLLTMWNTYRLGEQSSDLRVVAVETHDALCALYNKEVQANVEAEEFLIDNPKGLLSSNGDVVLSRQIIQRGIDQRTDTITALRTAGLDCTGEVIT